VRTRGTLLIAKKEYLDKVRNKWILALSILFAVFGILLAYLGAAQRGEVGIRGFQDAVMFLSSLMALLIPLIALILGYGTVAGEDENGSLGLVMSLAVTRNDIILGKFLGLGAVLATTVLVGLGTAGIVIAALAGAADWPAYLAFVGVGILLGLVYLALAILLSSKLKRRSTAIGGAVFIFFLFSTIYDLIIYGIYIGTGGSLSFMDPEFELPDWVWTAFAVNPSDSAQFAAFKAAGIQEAAGYVFATPDFLTMPLLAAILVAWTLIPLALAFVLFSRRDV
jgi:ABC-type transport system involved in multi-copper enzyme maturation permease subunit